MFSTLYHVKMAENINKLIDFLWINFWIIIYKNKNLKKIKLSAFCKIRLNVIQKKKIYKYWFAKFVVFHELYITHINYCHDFSDILHNKKVFWTKFIIKIQIVFFNKSF